MADKRRVSEKDHLVQLWGRQVESNASFGAPELGDCVRCCVIAVQKK